MKFLMPAFLALILAGCALPETSVRTGSPRPTMVIKGAPADSTLAVDGLQMGAAPTFDGKPKVLVIEEGVHLIEIRRANNLIHSERTFVSNGETRTITVNAGAQ
jgi:hypothetical protein